MWHRENLREIDKFRLMINFIVTVPINESGQGANPLDAGSSWTLFGVWDVLFDADHTRLTLEEIILSEYFHEGASNSTDLILIQVFWH